MKTPSKQSLESLIADGYTMADIARVFGVSRQAIHKKLGYVPTRVKKPSTFKYEKHPHVTRWKQCTLKYVLLLKALGASNKDIAKATGYKLGSISQITCNKKTNERKLK